MNIILQFWPALLLVLIGSIVFFLIKFKFDQSDSKQDLSVYERKPYLFDVNSEFNLYKVLLELFGDKYFIFSAN